MGSSQSSSNLASDGGAYKHELYYYPQIEYGPVKDQDFFIVEPRHLQRILNGEFSEIFEDEEVEHVWIYFCYLKEAKLFIRGPLNHQFVMFQTKKWLYVASKGSDGCFCFRASHDLKSHLIEIQKQYTSEDFGRIERIDELSERAMAYQDPQIWKEDQGTYFISETGGCHIFWLTDLGDKCPNFVFKLRLN